MWWGRPIRLGNLRRKYKVTGMKLVIHMAILLINRHLILSSKLLNKYFILNQYNQLSILNQYSQLFILNQYNLLSILNKLKFNLLFNKTSLIFHFLKSRSSLNRLLKTLNIKILMNLMMANQILLKLKQ